ncbi:hypothetical protein D0Y65_046270 [Glycine soja]|uniref:Uncharacterized protein n=1 Tax=Glycine soja TaxID=3848 RepID=A0A445G8I8_GLYSO|nr:hypothetical protein D0Y65_046270 [Glycine soja]
MPAECSYPTMPSPLPYLKKEKKWGYEAWERLREVSDTTGKRSPKYSTRSPFFLAAMGSTCKQGKPNGNQKREGTTLINIGQKTIQKAKAHPAEIGSEGCLPSS